VEELAVHRRVGDTHRLAALLALEARLVERTALRNEFLSLIHALAACLALHCLDSETTTRRHFGGSRGRSSSLGVHLGKRSLARSNALSRSLIRGGLVDSGLVGRRLVSSGTLLSGSLVGSRALLARSLVGTSALLRSSLVRSSALLSGGLVGSGALLGSRRVGG
jgi:hypothetical protein